jgi:hypothetical protein
MKARKALFLLVFALAVPVFANAQSGITGTWKVKDVGFAPWTIKLQADGTKLTGTVQQSPINRASGMMTDLTQPIEIFDGSIDGDTISFKCSSPDNGDRTVTFAGKIHGDEITFTRTVKIREGGDPGSDGIYGASGASHFTAKRSKSHLLS